jgi:hypothetical protein
MKLLFVVLALGFSFKASAAPLEAVDCKREMLASALANRVQNSSLKALLSSNYEITDFDYRDIAQDTYLVTLADTSRVDGSVTTVNYETKVISLKTCKVAVKLIAE